MKLCPVCDWPMIRLLFIEELIGLPTWVCDRCAYYFKDLFEPKRRKQ